jgi:hypothetical protein
LPRPDGGRGLNGHANTNEELVTAARAQIRFVQAGQLARKVAVAVSVGVVPPLPGYSGPSIAAVCVGVEPTRRGRMEVGWAAMWSWVGRQATMCLGGRR